MVVFTGCHRTPLSSEDPLPLSRAAHLRPVRSASRRCVRGMSPHATVLRGPVTPVRAARLRPVRSASRRCVRGMSPHATVLRGPVTHVPRCPPQTCEICVSPLCSRDVTARHCPQRTRYPCPALPTSDL